jgi:putative ABC transport system permease protein
VLGRPAPAPGEESEANIRSVSANYFSLMGVPLGRGRAFADSDRAGLPEVVVINQTLATRLFGAQDPVGQRIRFTFAPDQPAREIVGVVGDEKMGALDKAASPVLYTHLAQDATLSVGVALKVAGDAGATVGLARAVRSELRALDAGMVVSEVRTVDELVDAAPWMFLRRFPTLLVGVFAALALLLAMVGVYGVIAYSVGQRVQELGVRLALGAQRGQVQWLVVRQGLTVALLGITLGGCAAFALAKLLQSQLFEVSPADPTVLLGGSAVLLAVALLASWLPARRASRVDPAAALR